MRSRGKTLIRTAGLRLRLGGAIAFSIAMAATALAQSPQPTTISPNAPSVVLTAAAKPAAASSPASLNASTTAPPDAQAVISYLSSVINWYGHLSTEAQLVRDPDETLFCADDRQVAGEVLRLGFEYARAQAAYFARTGGGGAAALPAAAGAGAAGLGNVTQTYETLDAAANQLSASIKGLRAQLAKASARQRAAIAAEIQNDQNLLDLNRARAEAFKALAQYESGSASPEQSDSLAAQIDELEHSISDANKKSSALPAEVALAPRAESTGILSLVTELFALSGKLEALDQNRALAAALAARATELRKSNISLVASLVARGNALKQDTGAADVATLKERKKSFESLLEEYKLVSAPTLMLSKQIVQLGIYSNNVGKWHDAVEQRWKKEFRNLVIRLTVLGGVFVLIFLGSLGWRWLTDRYVTDVRRRGQVMAARRLVLGLIILIVVLINFADEIGSAATVVGFAAAGIAVALQNVILSIAGYFFLIGRFGIKAGDRVQIGGVTGIGLVKLSLMELGGTGTHREPTGRVAVFSNAIVFQPSGNFFKQAPGTSFVWNEVRLTLAPDVDYRLAEKRILDAVDEVFARYRDRVMRDYRHLERDLNVMLETPKPQSRLHLSQTGLEIIIHYPAETYTAPQITDEISRRVLDAINKEPRLCLSPQTTANIQVPPPPNAEEAMQAAADEQAAGDEVEVKTIGAAGTTPAQK